MHFVIKTWLDFITNLVLDINFLADNVITLNKINPQIASRLLTPLTHWRKQQPQRQVLMQAQLQRILDVDGLSKDVYEVASKSLGYESLKISKE